ncbi:MAG: glutathione S-transferase family protein [Rhodobacter sp.]|nr:glutathione S-transferase family protein [Paracoccaceae bacterium]MCC0075574.1 glutathione S-transferase family protein [Rhodobacter sp.]
MSHPSYVLIGASSTRAGRVAWMLNELGVPFEHVEAKPHQEDVTRHYPRGKVPVLLVDGVAITDSAAIIQYLADAHGRFTRPAGTLDRAQQDGLTHCILDEFDAILWTGARHSFILPEERRVAGIKDSLRWEFTRNQASFAKRMGDGPYLMGDELTVPDILLAHCLIWARAAKFEITEPTLDAYFDRIKERPAFQRTFARR